MKRLFLTIIVLLLAGLPLAEAQVAYTVTGVFKCHAHDGKIGFLHTADGRVFEITGMDLIEAGKWDEKNVVIQGQARQADQIGELRVEKISAAAIAPGQVVLPPMKAHQRPPKLVGSRGSAFSIRDVRWGYQPGQPKDNDHFQFVQATIDTNLIDRCYFVLKPFPPEWIAAHSLYLFTFKNGGCVNAVGQQAKGLFLSIEAYQNKNQNYSLTQGLKNVFGVSWILTTWEDYTEQSCGMQNEKLFLYPMKLSPQQTSGLLKEAIVQATANRSGEYYNTVTNNCTNNLIVLLNKVLPKEKQFKMWTIPSMVYNMKATMPVLVPKLLAKAGLIGSVLPELNHGNYRTYISTQK